MGPFWRGKRQRQQPEEGRIPVVFPSHPSGIGDRYPNATETCDYSGGTSAQREQREGPEAVAGRSVCRQTRRQPGRSPAIRSPPSRDPRAGKRHGSSGPGRLVAKILRCPPVSRQIRGRIMNRLPADRPRRAAGRTPAACPARNCPALSRHADGRGVRPSRQSHLRSRL